MNAPAPHTPELMAPAGSPDAGYAALHYGADAIYLGLRQFSARAEAENFSLDDVSELTAYAHSLTPRRKVFATVNTLILQNEIPELVNLLGTLSDMEVDAVIVQDLGVTRTIRRHLPELRLHASTQLACHHRFGVETLRDMGFARVTLARELTIDEIRTLSAIPGVETEIFVHGALCYSYSGLCLFSSLTLGRSGNRGRCAYLCRDHFQAGKTHDGFLFSMKDLALAGRIPTLAETGVASFKIEGRMKAPLYVAATTNYSRRLLNHSLSPQEQAACEADIQAIFSRPWTDLHIAGPRSKDAVDPDFVGHRGAPAGNVLGVTRRGGIDALRFRTARPIELHDGLQVDVPGMGKPFGFAINRIEIVELPRGAKRPEFFEAPAGAVVEIELPTDHPQLPEGAAVYCSSSQDVKRRYRFDKPKPGEFRIRRSMNTVVELSAAQVVARVAIPPRHERDVAASAESSIPGPFSPARNPAQMESAVRGAFGKLGDTPFAVGAIELRNPETVFVPVSLLNALRRDATASLDTALTAARHRRRDALLADSLAPLAPATGDVSSGWAIKVDRAGYLDRFEAQDWNDVGEVVVDITCDPAAHIAKALNELAGPLGRERIRLALPIITRSWEERELLDRIRELHGAGWTRWEVANISGWGFLQSAIGGTADLATDWSIYITNALAARQVMELGATRFTLSPEDGLNNMRLLLTEFAGRATVIVHQDTPLFISETCVRSNAMEPCPGRDRCTFEKEEMTSSHGDRVLAVNRNCRTILLGLKPFSLAERLEDLRAAGALHLRADFIYRPYSPEQVRDTWRTLRQGQSLMTSHVGNFDRGLM